MTDHKSTKRTVNVHEAKTHLSRLLKRVERGEEFVLAKAGRPVARLVPFHGRTAARVLGGARGQVWMADDFNAPLPDEVLADFER